MSEEKIRKLLDDVERAKARAEATLERTSKRLRESKLRIRNQPEDGGR